MTLIPRRVRAQAPQLPEQPDSAPAGTPVAHDVYARNELIRATAHALHATGMVEGIHSFAVARALHAAGLLADPRNTP